MGFYAYRGLNRRPFGAGNSLIIQDTDTIKGVLERVRALWGDTPCRIYTFTDLCDEATFTLVMEIE